MKKVIIILLSVALVAILGLSGYLVIKINSRLDEQNKQISTLINEIKSDDENSNNTNTSNQIANSTSNNMVNGNLANSTSNSLTNNSFANSVNQNNINTNTNNANNTNSNTANNQVSPNSSIEDKVKAEYLNKLKSTYVGYTDYRIDGIRVLTETEKNSVVNNFGQGQYKATDTLAVVTYSLKPQTIEGYQVVGNGDISGDWVVNKSACVCYRDGEIVSDGTGW